MRQTKGSWVRLAHFLALGVMLGTAGGNHVHADFDAPPAGAGTKACSKFKKGSKDWKACMGQARHSLDEAYELAYWLARTGEYQRAIDVLGPAAAHSDYRILTVIGYATRHLGRIDEALGHYERALAANPDSVKTRQYLGEALLQKDRVDLARQQLAEIAARCGTTCEDYLSLGADIANYEMRRRG